MARRKSDSVELVIQAIIHETDRGCVLVSAAYVEDVLRSSMGLMLKELRTVGLHDLSLKEYDAIANSLLDGVLGRAATRVAFCRAVGVIDSAMAKALASLFELRNKHFAHFAGVSRLNDPRAAKLLEEFVANVAKLPQPTGAPFSSEIDTKKHSKARRIYMDAFGSLAIVLLQFLDHRLKVSPFPV